MSARSPLERARPPHYPRTFTKRPKQDAAAIESLFRQVDVHPARFVVGMDSEERPLYPEPLHQKYPEEMRHKMQGTATSMASYVARVDEVTKEGGVSITLWERPNGREGMTVLSVEEHLEGKRPSVGDLLWIWTWIDVVDHVPTERIHVEIKTKKLTEQDRVQLRELLAQLQGDMP